MLPSIKDKLTRIFIVIVLILNLLAVVAVFFYIKPKLLINKINYYKNIVNPVAENAKINLFQTIVTGQLVASNISTFYSQSSSMYLSDEYLNIISKDILNNNFYIKAIGYIIQADLEIRLTNEDYIDQNFMYRGLWYKDYNQQIRISHFQIPDFDDKLLVLESKNRHTYVFGKPFLFRFSGDKVLVQPLVFPIFVGDKFVGSVILFVSVEFINEYLDLQALPSDIKFFAVNQDGIILSYPHNPELMGDDIKTIFSDKTLDVYQLIKQQNLSYAKIGDEYIILSNIKISSNEHWVVGLIVPAEYLNKTVKNIVLGLIAFALIISFITYLIYRQLTVRLATTAQNLIKLVDDIYKGKIDKPLPRLREFSEINQMSEKLEKLRSRLLELTQIHKNIGDRVYDQKFPALDYDDRLAESINYALTKILDRWKRRNQIEISKQRTDWINTGLAKIYEATRVEQNSLEIMTNRVLETLIEYTGAFLGGLFIYEEDKNVLKAYATFAYEDPRVFKREIALGEGLVGNVALERKRRYITDIPKDYNVIIVGLGETKPKSIIIQPLIFENELLGILELAFLKELEDYELEFIDKAALTISQAIKTIKINIRTEQLLEQSQKQAKELEEARQLLQKHIAELEKREKELQENQARMKGILDAVNHTLMTIEYTTEGILITANEKYLKTMHYTLDELVGVNVLDLVRTEREELAEVIKRVSQGEYFEKIMKRFTKYGEVRWLYSTYTPYYDVNGKITKILYFAFDVTDTYNKIQELEKEVENLRKQVELLEKALKEQ